MFPMRGSFHGPGGSFAGEILDLDLSYFENNEHGEKEGKEGIGRGKMDLHWDKGV